MYLQRICKECGSDRLVEDYSDGSLVCSNCGLVAEPFLLDDRPLISKNVNFEREVDNKAIDTLIAETCFKLTLPDAFAHQSSQHYKDILSSFKKTHSKVHQVHKSAMRVISITEICKQNNVYRSMESVASLMGVEMRSVRELQKGPIQYNHQKHHKNVNLPRWKLLVNQILDNPSKKMQVLAMMEKIDKTLSKNPSYIHKKPSKMDGVLLYFACDKLQLKDISQQEIMKVSKVSESTFKNHLKLINKCILSQTLS